MHTKPWQKHIVCLTLSKTKRFFPKAKVVRSTVRVASISIFHTGDINQNLPAAHMSPKNCKRMRLYAHQKHIAILHLVQHYVDGSASYTYLQYDCCNQVHEKKSKWN